MRKSLGFSLTLVLLLATSCRVSTPIKAGQKVSINPCSLVEAAKVEKVLGGTLAPAALWQSIEQVREGERVDSASCSYERRGAEGTGEHFVISVQPETKAELQESGEKVPRLGRDAVIREQERFGLLNMYVLSDEGARLHIGVPLAGKDQKVLVREITPLAKEALQTIKTKFPGKDVIEATPPPVDVCSLVSDEDVTRLSQSSGGSQGDGFKEEETDGSWGGYWGCWYLPADAIVIVRIPKNPVAYETLMATGMQVKGLGAKAYWKPPVREPAFIDGKLFVVAKNGKAFGVNVDRYDAETLANPVEDARVQDDQAHKDLAIEVAKIILTRI